MWEKMVGHRQGKTSERTNQFNAIVKGVVISMKVKPITTSHDKEKRYNTCCSKSCISYIYTSCKAKTFCYKHANQSTKYLLLVMRSMLKLLGVVAGIVLEAKRNGRMPQNANECSLLCWGNV